MSESRGLEKQLIDITQEKELDRSTVAADYDLKGLLPTYTEQNLDQPDLFKELIEEVFKYPSGLSWFHAEYVLKALYELGALLINRGIAYGYDSIKYNKKLNNSAFITTLLEQDCSHKASIKKHLFAIYRNIPAYAAGEHSQAITNPFHLVMIMKVALDHLSPLWVIQMADVIENQMLKKQNYQHFIDFPNRCRINAAYALSLLFRGYIFYNKNKFEALVESEASTIEKELYERIRKEYFESLDDRFSTLNLDDNGAAIFKLIAECDLMKDIQDANPEFFPTLMKFPGISGLTLDLDLPDYDLPRHEEPPSPASRAEESSSSSKSSKSHEKKAPVKSEDERDEASFSLSASKSSEEKPPVKSDAEESGDDSMSSAEEEKEDTDRPSVKPKSVMLTREQADANMKLKGELIPLINQLREECEAYWRHLNNLNQKDKAVALKFLAIAELRGKLPQSKNSLALIPTQTLISAVKDFKATFEAPIDQAKLNDAKISDKQNEDKRSIKDIIKADRSSAGTHFFKMAIYYLTGTLIKSLLPTGERMKREIKKGLKTYDKQHPGFFSGAEIPESTKELQSSSKKKHKKK